jgi:AcrR family transcriptional regulator
VTADGAARVADRRARILQAAVVCIERRGLAKTSLEDVSTEAGVSRATLYRWFPGGRDQLVTETIAWELGRFLDDLGNAMAPEPDVEAKLVRGLVWGHEAIEQHALLQRILRTEPELFLTEFHSSVPVLAELARAQLVELLRDEPLRPGVDLEQAADYVGRLFLSYLGSHGRWDLSDKAAVTTIVRTQLLAGVMARDGSHTPDPFQ